MISIVIPIYNASDCLRRCLDSIVNQTFKEYEVWLINDGSTDSSGAICEEYTKKYQQFNVYHGVNKGVSHARNIGIGKAFGEYITFVDADDYLDKQFLEMLLPKDGADFTIGAVRVLTRNGISKVENILCPNPGGDKSKINCVLNHHLVRTVWGKLFKRSIIIELEKRFDPKFKIGEDTLFVLSFLKEVQTTYIAEYAGYNYVQPAYSLNKYKSAPNELINLYDQLFRYVRELEMKDYDLRYLKANNRNVIGFNLLTQLYLTKLYSRKQKRYYIDKLNEIDKGGLENLGLPKIVETNLRFIERIGFRSLMELFLLFSMRLIWLKSNVVRKYSCILKF